ncbi:hypothetical protein P0D88_37290 [Paraburkholderia sp. RL18-103-BIB-C]|jgi:hypothetical protein|uniref:hypothetical protein n=1 Tax=unclassified Paraburkholderia TaxID=2615204 RepID=UPI0038BAA074
MPLLALLFGSAWLYGMGSLVYVPIKLATMRWASQDIWGFLTRRRLTLMTLIYCAGAPVPGIVALAIAGAGGSNSGGFSDGTISVAWGLCYLFLAAATASLFSLAIRPTPNAKNALPD